MVTNISRIKELILQIGKCDLKYEHKSKSYNLNDFNTIGLDLDYYSSLNSEFNQKITLQLANKKLDKTLLTELIKNINTSLEYVKEKKDQCRVTYLFDKSKDNLNQEMLSNQEFTFSILEAQFSTLNNIHKFLLNLFEELDYILDDELAELKSKTSSYESSSENVKLPRVGKVTIDLRKKDTLSLFLLLEEIGIIDSSNLDRNKFIEQNFNYTNDNNKIMPIVNINSDFSNLKDISDYKIRSRNKKSFDRLIDKLTSKLESFDYMELASKLK